MVFLIASLFLLSIFLTPFFSSSPHGQNILLTFDWAGYVVASDLVNPQLKVIVVNGSWTVPKVSVSLVDSFSAAWIGIGGQFDDTLIQAGTEHDSINGQEEYSAGMNCYPMTRL
jgi:hypothetical protein